MSNIENAQREAMAQYDSIVELVRALAAEDTDTDTDTDTARERIQEDALEVSVRSGWYAPGHIPPEPEEFLILLCSGGPAVRIIGELDDNEPTRAWLQCQDWFTPWTNVTDERIDHDVLLTYCRQFYFGE